MAEHVAHPPRSERFIKAYLFVWGLLAAGGLTYLATLVWQPDWLSAPPRRPQIAEAEPDPALRMATRAIAEVRDVRRSVGDVQKSLGDLRETLDRSLSEDRGVQTRLSALEERVTDMAAQPGAVVAAAPVAGGKAKGSDKPPPPSVAAAKAAEPLPATRVMSATMAVPGQPEKGAATVAAPAIETGSIGAATITFGEPVVTRSSTNFAVQLGAGRTVEALKLSWSLLLDQHGDALSPLQPRVIVPRTEGGSYRLVAGPFDTRAEAEKICSAMSLSRNKCFSTVFTGQPL
ncbi:MAG: SPOR domain-containing protein [Hyphomicrobiaceae bacterium]